MYKNRKKFVSYFLLIFALSVCFCGCEASSIGVVSNSEKDVIKELPCDESGLSFSDETFDIDLDGNATVFYEVESSSKLPYFKMEIENKLNCSITICLDVEKVTVPANETSTWVYSASPLKEGKHTFIFMPDDVSVKLNGKATLVFAEKLED